MGGLAKGPAENCQHVVKRRSGGMARSRALRDNAVDHVEE